MTTDILQILQSWLPPGCIGAVAVWLTNRIIRAMRTTKEVHDTYKTMYDNIQATLIELQNENIKLYKAVRGLNRTIQKTSICKHYADCPVRDELQKSGQISADLQLTGQSTKRKRIRANTATRTAQCGEDEIPDECAGDDTSGHRL